MPLEIPTHADQARAYLQDVARQCREAFDQAYQAEVCGVIPEFETRFAVEEFVCENCNVCINASATSVDQALQFAGEFGRHKARAVARAREAVPHALEFHYAYNWQCNAMVDVTRTFLTVSHRGGVVTDLGRNGLKAREDWYNRNRPSPAMVGKIVERLENDAIVD